MDERRRTAAGRCWRVLLHPAVCLPLHGLGLLLAPVIAGGGGEWWVGPLLPMAAIGLGGLLVGLFDWVEGVVR